VADKQIKLLDQKPYLIRAMYDWLSDNNVRPHVMVELTHPKLQIPPHLRQAITKKKFEVFNISMNSTGDLHLGNEEITCKARFGGKLFCLVLPIDAIAAIYSPDEPMNGGGMQFQTTPWAPDHKQAGDAQEVEEDLHFGDGTSKDPLLGPVKKETTPAEPKPGDRPSWLKVVK
jgi:stringent starvation protein B